MKHFLVNVITLVYLGIITNYSLAEGLDDELGAIKFFPENNYHHYQKIIKDNQQILNKLSGNEEIRYYRDSSGGQIYGLQPEYGPKYYLYSKQAPKDSSKFSTEHASTKWELLSW